MCVYVFGGYRRKYIYYIHINTVFPECSSPPIICFIPRRVFSIPKAYFPCSKTQSNNLPCCVTLAERKKKKTVNGQTFMATFRQRAQSALYVHLDKRGTGRLVFCTAASHSLTAAVRRNWEHCRRFEGQMCFSSVEVGLFACIIRATSHRRVRVFLRNVVSYWLRVAMPFCLLFFFQST